MIGAQLAVLTTVTMVAFAANSVFCRQALTLTAIDPAAFTLIRIGSGAAVLYALASMRGGWGGVAGSWPAAVALFLYAACFSFAYLSLAAATGALLLFAAVQATMILRGLMAGERLNRVQWIGFAAALAGVLILLLPGATAPEPVGAALMMLAGMAWGAYSLMGRRSGDPLTATAGNFLRAMPLAVLPAVVMAAAGHWSVDAAGVAYAVLSGALASGCGYALWYSVLPGLGAINAASVQLSVPVITALGGVLLLGEMVSARLVLASVAVLGGIALVVRGRLRGVV